MDHRDHVRLLRPAELDSAGTWADFGAGSGAFTLALRELIGPQAQIHAVDQERMSLLELERVCRDRYGSADGLFLHPADFTGPLELPRLDGLLMANSLHFSSDPQDVLLHAASFLKADGMLLLVEYNAERGNSWVPYPVSFRRFQSLAPQAGFGPPRLLARHPSRFLKEIYSAAARRRSMAGT
jgi:ubiquinone/menaquinone biosynthesis C-methylase UbiE